MDAQVTAEIAIAALLQLGALLWFLSGLKADIRNMTGWLRSTAHQSSGNATELAELRGRVESLPCAACGPRPR